ncbi:unnamed protein product [Didymodactylos carnosus]|uniref:Uncharacterized protein n=1 Tax=Didymodactylos carnosus TaxID=1234261 RepID=A0A8S2LPM9_9BILA|nr:unnamed protein product [Didymodactylos carnosus]CAF3909740.1 unnamed protein product [Didymodactylos carnosus]
MSKRNKTRCKRASEEYPHHTIKKHKQYIKWKYLRRFYESGGRDYEQYINWLGNENVQSLVIQEDKADDVCDKKDLTLPKLLVDDNSLPALVIVQEDNDNVHDSDKQTLSKASTLSKSSTPSKPPTLSKSSTLSKASTRLMEKTSDACTTTISGSLKERRIEIDHQPLSTHLPLPTTVPNVNINKPSIIPFLQSKRTHLFFHIPSTKANLSTQLSFDVLNKNMTTNKLPKSFDLWTVNNVVTFIEKIFGNQTPYAKVNRKFVNLNNLRTLGRQEDIFIVIYAANSTP